MLEMLFCKENYVSHVGTVGTASGWYVANVWYNSKFYCKLPYLF